MTTKLNLRSQQPGNGVLKPPRRKLVSGVFYLAAALTFLPWWFTPLHAQGIYMGRDGNVHPQIIVGANGAVYPVAPTYCQNGWGPCPVLLGPPLGPFAPLLAPPPPPPLAYAPPPPPPPPPPLGWIWGRLAPCAAPDCSVLTVQVVVDGANIRGAPGGPVVAAIANGTPIIPLQKVDGWVLVAPACALAPTWTISVTAGVPLMVCA